MAPAVRLDRSYFALQASFARRVSVVTGIPDHEALRLNTTFYNNVASDNDAGSPPERWQFDPGDPGWQHFLRVTRSGADVVDYIHEQHVISQTEEQGRPAPCFRYEYWARQRWVRLHFGNSRDGLALRPESIPARLQELRSIFADVSVRHPNAVAVRGASWLYHVPAYRRFFPAAYLDGLASVGHLHQFAALWGQFLDAHGRVKPRLRDQFLTAIARASTMEELNAAFPHDVLATTCKIDSFYELYGVRGGRWTAPSPPTWSSDQRRAGPA